MASQTGILGLQGTVGGLVFAKNGTVRQKPASNKAAFASSASLARTRENAAEFGLSAKYTKLLRDSLRVAIASASDSRLASRLTKAMRAMKLRAKADAKARRYAQLLAGSVGAAEDAAAQMNALNQLYNTDVSTYMLLTQALHANNVKGALVDKMAQSTPGEEVVLFNQVPDGNGRQELPADSLFGEVVTGTPIIPSVPSV